MVSKELEGAYKRIKSPIVLLFNGKFDPMKLPLKTL